MIFWKYHGLGNDFILFENLDLSAPIDPGTVRRLCDRRFGIGADGILYINPDAEADAFMKIMNSDGSEAEMCGNGIRCVAKHLYDLALVRSERMRINTMSGMKDVEVFVDEGEVHDISVDMGAPKLDCKDVPMNCEGRFIDGTIDVDGLKIKGTAVSMGNPHFVVFQDLSDEEVLFLGPKIERHKMFPRKTNTEFVKVVGDVLEVKVYERGASWTLACGTGACATAVAAVVKGISSYDKDIKVKLPGGQLTINVRKDLSTVKMTGPAVRVFQGEVEW